MYEVVDKDNYPYLCPTKNLYITNQNEKMKTTLTHPYLRGICLILLYICCSSSAMAKYRPVIWENPIAEGEIACGISPITITVSRVEMKETETVVSLNVEFYPKNWIRFDKGTYIKAGDKRYAVTGSEGIELDQKFYMPDSGRADMTLRFAPLPAGTTAFDIIEGDGKDAFQLLNIHERAKDDTRTFPANWRNNATGEWVIGLLDECAVYDCQFWDYKVRDEKHGRFVLSNGDRELTVKVGKLKKGTATITIGGGEAMKCSRISGRFLPDYPVADNRPALKDNGYRTGDSITITGWLRNMSPSTRRQGEVFSLAWDDLLDNGKEKTQSCRLDSLGRFSITVPVDNTQCFFLDWTRVRQRTVLEPGNTYMLLIDFRTGQTLFMGEDCRLQNEMLAVQVENPNRMMAMGKRNATADDAEQYLAQMESYNSAYRSLCDSMFAAHPMLSERYKRLVIAKNLVRQASALGQSRFSFAKFTLPPNATEYAHSKYWQHLPTPLSAYSSAETFIRDYTDNLLSVNKDVDRGGLYLNDLVNADEETRKWVFGTHQEDCEKLRKAIEDSTVDPEERRTLANNLLEIPEVNAVIHEVIFVKRLKAVTALLDSIGTDATLRDITLTNMCAQRIDHERVAMSGRTMDSICGMLHLPAARQMLMAKNDVYVALANRPVRENSRPQTTVGDDNLSEGEALLRKITEPFKGRMVLIDVWGTWCVPCKMALEESKKEYAELEKYGLVYLYLANRSEKKAQENIIKLYGVEGPDVFHYNLPKNQQDAIERFLNVRSYPSYRLMDRDGKVLDVNADPRDLNKMKRMLDTITGGGK